MKNTKMKPLLPMGFFLAILDSCLIFRWFYFMYQKNKKGNNLVRRAVNLCSLCYAGWWQAYDRCYGSIEFFYSWKFYSCGCFRFSKYYFTVTACVYIARGHNKYQTWNTENKAARNQRDHTARRLQPSNQELQGSTMSQTICSMKIIILWI